MTKLYCPCGFPQSSPVPHAHDLTEREKEIIKNLQSLIKQVEIEARINELEKVDRYMVDTHAPSAHFQMRLTQLQQQLKEAEENPEILNLGVL